MQRLRLLRRSRMGIAVLLGTHVVAGCDRGSNGTPSARGAESASADVVAEARSFMDAYARDLLAGNRAGIAARYDRTGAHLLGNGHKQFAPYDSVVAMYNDAKWSAPPSFEWRDLTFEPAGDDAVVVAGQFAWGRANGPPTTFSYMSLLRRQDGVLRIRVEDESLDPAGLPPRPPADSARK